MGFFNFDSDEDSDFRKYSEKYKEITGIEYSGDNIHDLKRRIESEIDGGWTSMREEGNLNELLSKIKDNE